MNALVRIAIIIIASTMLTNKEHPALRGTLEKADPLPPAPCGFFMGCN